MEGNAQAKMSQVTSIAYSAGGIWPCIVGTALLVVGSMILALVIGISAAIYLSEYSRETSSYSLHSHRDFEPGWGSLDCFRPFRFWILRHFLWLERFASGGLVHPRSDDFAGDHHRQ